jgi:hypothetical protein
MKTKESCGGVESRHADNLLDGDALAPIASAVKRIGEQPEAAHSQQTHRAGVAPGPHDIMLAALREIAATRRDLTPLQRSELRRDIARAAIQEAEGLADTGEQVRSSEAASQIQHPPGAR